MNKKEARNYEFEWLGLEEEEYTGCITRDL